MDVQLMAQMITQPLEFSWVKVDDLVSETQDNAITNEVSYCKFIFYQ